MDLAINEVCTQNQQEIAYLIENESSWVVQVGSSEIIPSSAKEASNIILDLKGQGFTISIKANNASFICHSGSNQEDAGEYLSQEANQLSHIPEVEEALFVDLSSVQVGIDLKYSFIDFDDPDGDVEDLPSEVNVVNLVVLYPEGNNAYWQIGLGSSDFSLESGENQVGQDVNRTYLDFGYHTKLPIRYFSSWVGGGLGVVKEEYTERFDLRPSGFLNNEFDDREQNSLYLYLSLANYWRISKAFHVGLIGKSDISLEDGLSEYSLTARLIYGFSSTNY